MKTIVISAINIVDAGPLTILKDCLQSFSEWIPRQDGAYRVVAIVYSQSLVDYPNIEYMETKWPKKRWTNRLWYEYVSLRDISKAIGPVYLWLSLHDTSPTVYAQRRAVYCHNAFSFARWTWRDLFFSPRIALLTIFTKYIYRLNIHRNTYLIVQQVWFREAMHRMFRIAKDKIIVSRPEYNESSLEKISVSERSKMVNSFIYASSPNSHKNFEVVCKAVEILNERYNLNDFEVYITIDRNSNRYTRWLNKRWGHLRALKFIGFLSKRVLDQYYEDCDCLIFPSRVESWGLPISEFGRYKKYMLLADLPYAYETAGDRDKIGFFNPEEPEVLANMMLALMRGDDSLMKCVKKTVIEAPKAIGWSALFDMLVSD